MCLSLSLLVRGAWVGHGKQKTLDELSKALSLAITEFVNKPRATPGGIEQFATELRGGEYDEWCGGVKYILANRNHFSYSDFSHFDRLGFVPAMVMTRHPGADHTLAMLNLKMQRLREIIARNS